jgi:hypothetical protein
MTGQLVRTDTGHVRTDTGVLKTLSVQSGVQWSREKGRKGAKAVSHARGSRTNKTEMMSNHSLPRIFRGVRTRTADTRNLVQSFALGGIR